MSVDLQHAWSVTAIIPAYNEEKLLPRAIASVLCQTLPPQEIIVVDDGSKDRTFEVASSFGDRVRCVRQQNSGLASARNSGIRSAQGEYVALLDSDDEWFPWHLENAMQALKAHPEAHWFNGSTQRRAVTGELEYDLIPDVAWQGDSGVYNFFETQARFAHLNSSAIVVRTDIFREAGGFDESLKRGGEDLDMWFRIALAHPLILYSRIPSAVYWRRAGSIMTRNLADSRYFLERIQRTARHAIDRGDAAIRMSDPLVLRWVSTLVRHAYEEGNRDVLKDVSRLYGQKLPLAWRALAAAGGMLPGKLDMLVYRVLWERAGLRQSGAPEPPVDRYVPPSMSGQTRPAR